MHSKRIVASLVILAFGASGCATASKDISATYVSPVQYKSYDCDQVQAEAQRLQARVHQLGGRLDEAANNDKAIMGVGLVLFWPALFALGGTKQQEAEYSRLKGEYDALQQAAVDKKCGMPTHPQTAVPTAVPAAAPAAPAVAVPPTPNVQAPPVAVPGPQTAVSPDLR